jgi:hypothetical protein
MDSSPRIALLILLAALAACQRESAPAPVEAPDVVVPTKATTDPEADPSNAFAVQIALSAAARERLSTQHESLIVRAEYFGYPSAQALAQHVPGSENPWLTLHSAQIELEGAQLDGTPTARFPAIAFDAKQLAWTDEPGAPQVNINVYSGRRSSPDNVLDCGMFQDALASAARSPIRLPCGLIGEAAR